MASFNGLYMESDQSQRRETLTVTDLVRSVRSTLQATYGLVLVTGEISNFKRPASGHCYFTLKDANAQLRCVLFRSDAARLNFAPQDGMQVVVSARLDIYEARGDLQLRAISIKSAGEGALQKAFEQLKMKLEAEGLFDTRHKKPIPDFPQCVGVVTSPTGAALHDILTIIRRRYPVVQVVVAPVQVQGVEAAHKIANAIRALDSLAANDAMRPDVMIVGRGGGSAEDLWSFNEESVARAIHTCTIPIISAVGHETDFSIADFVSDVRAATPSMAAEIAVPDRFALTQSMASVISGAESHVRKLLTMYRRRLHHLVKSRGFNAPQQRVEQQYQRADDLLDRMRVLQKHRITTTANRVTSLVRQLDALDPRKTLERGYVRVERDGRPVRWGKELEKNCEVLLHFADTSRTAKIT